MASTFSLVVALTEQILPAGERKRVLREFARESGWRPSDELEEYAGTESVANGHLVVEHGLDRTAVITFLRPDHSVPDLSGQELKNLLSLSYNTLIDWHLFPHRAGIYVVNNRTEALTPRLITTTGFTDVWRADAFDKIVGRKPNPNFKALDDALMDTLSYWKRFLASECSPPISLSGISALFNVLIFIRALEDQRRSRTREQELSRILLDTWNRPSEAPIDLEACIRDCLQTLHKPDLPEEINRYAHQLSALGAIDKESITRLFLDFYENRFAPYRYDFSVISKHALSRIYEQYVTVLRDDASPQLQLFKSLPIEETNRSLGGVYTPQYVARFFARFLKENTAPRHFRALRAVDPACGSGMFLRTILEMQCDPLQNYDNPTAVADAFRNVLGIDIDPSACEATKLSLFLLHLVLTDSFPSALRVENAEALEYFLQHSELCSEFDVVVGNPPFIRWERILPLVRERIARVMGVSELGRVDMFTGMLKMGMDMVKPGGFLMYVLPHSFLLADNTRLLRETITTEFDIRLLADLSEIPVFENVGTYVILLILQKKVPTLNTSDIKATMIRCRDFVGQALQDALEGKRVKTDFYEVFEVEQRYFAASEWAVRPEREARVESKLRQFVNPVRYAVRVHSKNLRLRILDFMA